MLECSMYKIAVPDQNSRGRKLTFYAWRERKVEKALMLGFAAHNVPLNEEGNGLYEIRREREAANRSKALKDTTITDAKGRCFNERWDCQAVLVALWRDLEKIPFLVLPKNPFLGKRPRHEDIVDYRSRFRYFEEKKRSYNRKI